MSEEKNQKHDNLGLWDKVSKTPKEKTKQVTFGRKFTSVNPQYQIRCATQQFGCYGSGWGMNEMTYERVTIGEEILLILSANFYYSGVPGLLIGGHFPITNSTMLVKKGKTDTDAYKKLETDTLTKALSKLGFNADIFEGLYDDPNYIAQIKQDEELKEKAKGEYIETKPVTKLKGKEKLTHEAFKEIMDRINNGVANTIQKASGYYNIPAAQMAEMEQAHLQYLQNAGS